MLHYREHFLQLSEQGFIEIPLYMQRYMPHHLRVVIGQLRVSSHQLEIERGRARGLPRDERICPICHTEVESEEHFMVRCPAYSALRVQFGMEDTLQQRIARSDQVQLGRFLTAALGIREQILQPRLVQFGMEDTLQQRIARSDQVQLGRFLTAALGIREQILQPRLQAGERTQRTITEFFQRENLEERVIWIASKEDTLTSTSAAERALLSVATLLIRPENEDQELAKIRLLVARPQAKVFSKGGKMLESISDETGAVVNIFGKDKFPLLAFASQTDMLVQVEGKTFEVQQALELLVTRLRECLQKTRNVEQYKDKTASGVFKTAVQISIPSDHIGRLIGKDGSTLRQIKEQCRVSIEVLDDVEHGGQGKIAHLRGSLAQVTMAQTLLQTFLVSKRKAK
ncbi:hypothetical protein L7F22_062895 [Adiantum nelumboides]|nr:hypothetical protein [Adiantum nelumboides]